MAIPMQRIWPNLDPIEFKDSKILCRNTGISVLYEPLSNQNWKVDPISLQHEETKNL